MKNSEPRGVQHAPRILRLFIRPPANFRQSFASRVLKNRDFSGTVKFSSLYAGGPRMPPRVLAVWAKTMRGQKRQQQKKPTCNRQPAHLKNRPLAATSSRDVIFVKLWATTLRMPEMERAYRKYHNGQV